MPAAIETITTAALSVALDLAARQQSVLAANVANANSEGYLPLRLSFDEQLEQARSALRDGGTLDASALGSLREARLLPPDSVTGDEKVRLDAEMADLARNAVQFQALLQGVSRHLSLLALAAADGRK